MFIVLTFGSYHRTLHSFSFHSSNGDIPLINCLNALFYFSYDECSFCNHSLTREREREREIESTLIISMVLRDSNAGLRYIRRACIQHDASLPCIDGDTFAKHTNATLIAYSSVFTALYLKDKFV